MSEMVNLTEVAKTVSAELESFSVGDTVYHRKYGRGKVVRIADTCCGSMPYDVHIYDGENGSVGTKVWAHANDISHSDETYRANVAKKQQEKNDR